jgi:prepilin-type N-terminal cleavage/methylation domain-containing protein
MNKSSGFTLIELSIVLLVIGLITGGVIAGQSMIRSAQLRNTMGQITQYTQAVANFSDKYKALPGDFPKAEALWGSDTGCPTTTSNTVLKKATCNGDGDGKIGDYEQFRAWQQLSAAGFFGEVSGNAFSGVRGSGSTIHAVPGVNLPATSLPGGGIAYWSATLDVFESLAFDTPYSMTMYDKNAFYIGSIAASNGPFYNLFTPTEAAGIDTKLDDGLSLSGKITSFLGTTTPNCISGSTYNTSFSTAACALVYFTGF